MSIELSFKDLKALLDDNNIDLSMRQLVSIPVKGLSKIPRATYLDFSNNLIISIPPDFCLLTHVTKLDLSNNHIIHLPEEFGKLINLVHLDLYKNEVEELPLSFGELASLKWLDLKGNPLELELSQAAGECLNEKGCKMAALNVVRLMRDRSAKQQRLLEKQKSSKKQFEDSGAVIHVLTAQKEKTKKKKNKRRDLVIEHLKPTMVHAQQNVMSFWWRILTISFLFTLAVSVFAVVVVVTNCFSEPQSWSSLSRPFCGNLQTVITEHSRCRTLSMIGFQFPLTISGNFFLSITSLLKSYIDAAGAVWQEFEQKTDLVAFVKDSYYLLYMKLVSVGLLVQGYVVYKYDSFITFYNAYAADAVDNILKNMWLLLRIFGLMVADLLMFIVGEGLLFVSSVVETIFTYAYRGDQLAEVLQNWWNKVK
uniref:Leucine Rich Repeat family protein n=1 Tax=Wuchereria bancrofti TaxID=6293 RepID=A0A1I8E9A2_WUCBA